MTKFVRRPWERLGISRSKFYKYFVDTGRLKLVKPLGDKRQNSPSAVIEEELETVMSEIIATRAPNGRRTPVK